MDRKALEKEYPIVGQMADCREVFWENPAAGQNAEKLVDIDDAEARLLRFAPYIRRVFPQVKDGIIESPLREISAMQRALESSDMTEAGLAPVSVKGRLFLKCDSHLPVSGSVKARGGIYEVLKLAERIAMEKGMLSIEEDYGKLAEPEFRQLFSQYKVAVGSTGNLGLSIGIISAAMGFQVTVHMSADARQWKKDLLRAKGVKVVEYPDDYQAAVAQGRKEAEADPMCHFVDDENSLDLFAGYSVAGKRLKAQFEQAGITIDEKHRLYVYLPCGVGGAPGGITYGIKEYFGKNAFCFFAEPTHAPCMTLGLVTGLHNRIAVGDIGIDGRTEADGLAVGRPSALVAKAMESRLSGCYTVDDSKLYPYLAMLKDSEDIFIEPSACAAFDGLKYVNVKPEPGSPDGSSNAMEHSFIPPDEHSIHIIWATGGEMVPEDE
ncbi:MAG: D-serine ammonia-lyase, partial [Bacillota bacterium]|nr:D-serine ammonia-lyase [Bacillota bacterium]